MLYRSMFLGVENFFSGVSGFNYGLRSSPVIFMRTLKMSEIKKVDMPVRLATGDKKGVKVLRLYNTKQWAKANWFKPNQAIEIMARVKEITADTAGDYFGMEFDSIFAEEINLNKGELYIGYFQGKMGNSVQIRRASTNTYGEYQSKSKSGEVEII